MMPCEKGEVQTPCIGELNIVMDKARKGRPEESECGGTS
jgi:hypothetical protein